MSTRLRFAIFFAIFLGAILLSSGGNPGPTILLRDGSTLRFAGLTYGPPHLFIDDGFQGWVKYLLARRDVNSYSSGDHWWDLESNEELPIAWFVRDLPAGVDASKALKLYDGTIVDEHGCEVWARNDALFTLDRFNRRIITNVPLRALSPGAHQFRVRFWDSRLDAKPGPETETLVYTREPRGGSDWTPSPLPQSVEISDLTCTLKDVESKWEPYPGEWSTNGPGISRTHIRLSIQSRGVKAPKWRLMAVRFKDSAGNVSQTDHTTEFEKAGSDLKISFDAPLWKHVPAYDVEVDFAPTRHSKIPENEKKTLRLKQPTDVGGKQEPDSSGVFEMQGQMLEARYPEDWHREEHFVVPFTLRDPVQPDLRPVVISVRDDQGKNLEIPDDVWVKQHRDGFFGDDRGLEVQVPISYRNSRWLDVTFALVRTKTARFRVKPRFSGRPYALQPKRFK